MYDRMSTAEVHRLEMEIHKTGIALERAIRRGSKAGAKSLRWYLRRLHMQRRTGEKP